MKEKPNVFVVGAGKSGTSWLQRVFMEHPEIYVSNQKKEHNYFNLFYENGESEYLSRFLKAKEENYKVIADISPSYMIYENVPERIFEFNKDSKIIFLLRNPIERTYSHYLMLLRGGTVSEDIKYEILNDNSTWKHKFIENGLYFKHIERYAEYFEKNKIGVFFYDDLLSNPKFFLESIFSFLEINSSFEPEILNRRQHKTKKKVFKNRKLYQFLQGIYRRVYTAIPMSRGVLGQFRRSKFNESIQGALSKESVPLMTDEVKRELKEIFEKDNMQLAGHTEYISNWFKDEL